MRGTLTILCENTVTGPGGLLGEHGFACLLETAGGRFLFDTGQGRTILNNARLLDKHLDMLDGIILSHGHADHSGGLLRVLVAAGPLPVYAHPGIFIPRYWAGRYQRRANGCPFSRREVEGAGGHFVEISRFRELVPGLWLSGEVPRASLFETRDPNLVVESGGGDLSPDPFVDDLSLAIDTPRGLLVVTGCAHAGLVNILSHFQRQTDGRKIFAVVGGTHLAPAGEEQFAGTVDFLRQGGVERLGLSHCTGLPRGGELAQLFPGRVTFANVGFKIEF